MKTAKLLVLPMLLVAGAASAQDISQAPAYGQAELVTGFVPDPHIVSLAAGGSITVDSSLAPGCVGIVAEAPDYNLVYEAGDTYPLNIYAVSDEDTTLVVNLPDGSWVCNDDAEGFNPLVNLENPQSGLYNIWVGTYGEDVTPAQLKISEIDPVWSADAAGSAAAQTMPMAAGQAAATEGATYGLVTLETGFVPDPHRTELLSGGTVDAAEIAGGNCVGFVAGRPDVDLMYTGGDVYPLNLYVTSESDTTLVVNLPDGTWACNDDAEGFNPLLSFETPQTGLYNIWVGTYGDATNEASVLSISEVAPQW